MSICCKIKFGSCWAHNHIFFNAILGNVFPPPSFARRRMKSQIAILRLAYLVRVSHLHLTILSLFSIKEQTLHLTIWIIPQATTNPSAHHNFVVHFASNFLLLSYDFLRCFFPMPSTLSFFFFHGELAWGQIGNLIAPHFIKIYRYRIKDFKEDFIKIYINNIKDFREDFKYCKRRTRVLEL